MIDRRYRLDRWLNLSAELMQSLPPDYRAHIFAQLEKQARNQLAIARITEFNSICHRRLSRDLQLCLKLIVLTFGAFTFSMAPHLIAMQSGGGSVATSIGLLGGALASFFTHASAAEVLTGLKLKQSTQQMQKALQETGVQL